MADNIIEVGHLTKRFGDFTAVDDVSFSVERGERFAFLGPNGAGKSTAIKMLTTLLSPTGGSIRIDGHDPAFEAGAVRRSFGIVFQDPSLDDDLTAYENMDFHCMLYGLPKEARSARIEELLKFVELDDRAKSFVRDFSGGMKRRLEVARGLLHEPKIIFLDEPTLGLDPQTRNHLWSYLRTLNEERGVTIFFTTHYMEEAEQIAQRVAIIDHGKIIRIGRNEELMRETGTDSLEGAFLKLTGSAIREEAGSALDRMRQHRGAWTGRR